MTFDLRTMYWAFSVGAIVMAVALYWAFAGQMRDGLGRWTVGLVIQSAAWLLFGVRGIAPDALGFIAANALLTLSLSLQAASLLEFEHQRPPPWLIFGPVIAAVAAIAPLVDNPDLRFTMINALHGITTGGIAVMMLRVGIGGSLRARHLVMGGFAAAGALFLVRGTLSVVAPSQVSSALDPSGVHWALHLLAQAPILFIAIGYLVMHKERADAQLLKLATIDPLTGALNRRAFIEIAERELAIAVRNSLPLTVLMLDIDHFKRVNDTHGHAAGDAVLRQFARLTLGLLRKGDILVRYGGEEFCVLLPHTDAAGARILAERIRDMTERNAVAYKSQNIPVTVSIGLSALAPGTASVIEKLIDDADTALYQAKKLGRNRVVSAQSDGGEAAAA